MTKAELIDKLHKAHAQHRAKEFNSQARKLILACRECGGRAETSHVYPVQTRVAAQASAAASAPDQPAPTQPNPTEQDHCAKHRRKTPAGPHQGATVPNLKEGQKGSQAASAVAALTRATTTTRARRATNTTRICSHRCGSVKARTVASPE